MEYQVKTNDRPTFSLELKSDKVSLDIIDASFFNFGDESDDIGFEAENCKETSSSPNLTLSILRKGKSLKSWI